MSKERILLHACCATCAGHVIERLSSDFLPVIYFYNPNIHPLEEYIKRKDELMKYSAKLKLPFIEERYDPEEWFKVTKGLEKEPEKGVRCDRCFQLRLEKTASFALKNNFRYFTTTLSISPHKNSKKIISLGNNISLQKNVIFHSEDFKKQDGFKKTMEIAKKEGFYRQNYCGCLYSLR